MELDHYGSQVGAPGVFNKVEELVQVLTNGSFALIVGRCLQCVDRDGFEMEGQKIPSELFREGGPVGKEEATAPRFVVKLPSRPAAGTSSRHVGHHPVNLGGIIRVGLRVITNVGPAGGPKGHPGRTVAIELRRRERFIKNLKWFLPARGRCGRCGMHEEGGRRGYNVSRRLAADGLLGRVSRSFGLRRAELVENLLEKSDRLALTYHRGCSGSEGRK